MIWRIRNLEPGLGYEAKKVLEDKEAQILGGATTAVRDVDTERLFISGLMTLYITVCDPRKL